jgi:phosphoribosyl 1,2-cyclic phosphodiesterase
VRGTLPVAGQRSLRYGGNTSCVAMSFPQGQSFIFDAGTGIKELSNDLADRNKLHFDAKIFISHPHWDHINALPFFAPLYVPGNEFEILGPVHPNMSMRELISVQMDDVFFPITIKQFSARVYFRDLGEETTELDGITVKTLLLSHPGNCLGYRIEYGGRSVCYVTDNELFLPDSQHYNANYVERLSNFISGTDALITDTTYTDEEYLSKVGWGHSGVGQVVDLAHRSNVDNLYLVHHDPDQDDNAIDAKFESAQKQLSHLNSSTRCHAPTETLVARI